MAHRSKEDNPKKEYQYVEVWSGKVSERVTARISRMIDPPKEREFYTNEEYLKRVQKEEEHKRESKKRIQFKTDTEKYYINAQVIGFDGNISLLITPASFNTIKVTFKSPCTSESTREKSLRTLTIVVVSPGIPSPLMITVFAS